MAASNLTKTFANAGNRKKWTWSAWIKRSSGLGNQQCLLACSSGATTFHLVYFDGNDKLVHNYNQTYCNTDRVFRDTSGWYHLVCAVDTTQSTASNRVKFYVNGVQETLSGNFPSQNTDMTINNNVRHDISNGGANFNGQFYFDGYMSHVAFVDGQQLTPTTFGETDSTSGIWKFKSPSGVTWGTNGFHLKFENSAALGTDSSGNSNTFTVNGNLKQALDTPSNVYTTMNPLVNVPTGTYSNGNTQFNAGAEHRTGYGTLAFSTGKYYWEAKATGGSKYTIGLSDAENQSAYQQVSGANLIVGNSANSYLKGDAIGWYYTTLYKNGSTVASSIHQIVTNDIMMIACDADSGKIYYGVNGTWRVANSTTFNASSNDTTFTTGRFYVPACSNENCGWKFNFGNGYFGTDAVASAGTNASGNGIFEYDVPTGYTALSTKGLNL